MPAPEQVKQIVAAALALPEADRDAFAAREAAADPALLAEVRATLAAHASVERRGFLDADATVDLPAAETVGTVVAGKYKLLQKPGEGGFGTVFMAEQTRPVARRVALKVVKLGMDTRAVVARFEAERQALALMDHPHIARVLDAGATDAGRPFFAMDLVRGDPITLYCDRHSLPIPARLDLFRQVCAAVQHAHQKGVIHRDLKPNNVLVATEDGKPFAKVIDFGIAKATGQRLTEKTLFTHHGGMVGTLEYMSPEQAEGSLDVDTRSDVYSLGVILYELLTGTTPLERKRFERAAYGELQRIIREVEPEKPSTRLATAVDTLAHVAAHRAVEPKRLGGLVRGELDWMVMKALEKERARRYESPSGLAEDVGRYLDGSPVRAAPPGAVYRVRKFARKHRGPVLAGAAAAALLSAGLAGTTWQWRRAERSKNEVLSAQNAAKTALGGIFLDSLSSAERSMIPPNADPTTYGEMFSKGMGAGLKSSFGREVSDVEVLAIRARQIYETLVERQKDLVKTRDAAEVEAHVANLALAQAAMDNENWPEARDRLAACPVSKRGWEWAFLDRKSRMFEFSLPASANVPFLRPDGKVVLTWTLDEDGACIGGHLWDAATGLLIGNPLNDVGWTRPQFSPNGQTVVAVSGGHDEPTMRMWNSNTGKPIGEPVGFVGGYHSIIFSRDGRYAVTLYRETTQIWDCATGRLIGEPIVHDGYVTRAIFSADGEQILAWSDDGKVARLWTINTGSPKREPVPVGGKVMSSATSPDGRLALTWDNSNTSTDSRWRFWRTNTGELIDRAMSLDGQPSFASFDPTGHRVLITSRDANVAQLWDTHRVTPVTERIDSAGVGSDVFSPNGDTLVVESGHGSINLWNAVDGSFVREIRGTRTGYFWIDERLNFDGSIILAPSRGRGVGVWSIDGRPLALAYDPSGGDLGRTALIPNSRRLLVGKDVETVTSRVRIADVADFDSPFDRFAKDDPRDLEAALVLDAAPPPPATRPASSPADAALTAHPLPNGTVVLRSRDGAGVRVVRAERARLVAADVQPGAGAGGRLFTACDDRTVRVWDPATGRELASFRTRQPPTRLRCARDGARLVVDFADGTMEVWDARPVADRQRDRDARFAEGPAAKAHVAALLAGDAPSAHLAAAVRADGSLSVLRKLVVLEELDWELKRIGRRADKAFAKLTRDEWRKPELRGLAGRIDDVRTRSLVMGKVDAYEPEKGDVGMIVWRIVGDPARSTADYEFAVETAKEALRLDPNGWPEMVLLGRALYRAGRYGDAVAELNRAEATMVPGDRRRYVFLWATLAMAYHKLGDDTRAREAYATLQAIDFPSHDSREAEAALRAEAAALIDPASTQPATAPATRPAVP